MSVRTNWRCWLIVAAALCLGSLVIAPRPERNSVAWLAQKYCVSESKVEQVVSAFGVQSDELGSYGMADFPVNLISTRLRELTSASSTVGVELVEPLIRGYEVRCAPESPRIVYYAFFGRSVQVHGGGCRDGAGVAMVLRFVHRLDRAGGTEVLDNWSLRDLNDSGFDYERPILLASCDLR